MFLRNAPAATAAPASALVVASATAPPTSTSTPNALSFHDVLSLGPDTGKLAPSLHPSILFVTFNCGAGPISRQALSWCARGRLCSA